MTKSRLVLALAIILFLSSCNRYVTTYEAASRHNKCGKFIK
jgi:PBP1b-binding outer membrane lipoprotein LpoB